MAQAFAVRRVRIGVVVRGWPSETDSIGALVDAVTPGGPAATAGLLAGDIVTRFGGTPLAARPDKVPPGTKIASPGLQFAELVAKTAPNDTVMVEYRRGNAKKSTRVVTAADPDNLTVVLGPDGNYGFGAMPGGAEYWVGGTEGGNERALDMTLRRSELARGGRGEAAPPMPYLMGQPMLDLELAPVNPQLGSYFGTTDGVLVVDVPEPRPPRPEGGRCRPCGRWQGGVESKTADAGARQLRSGRSPRTPGDAPEEAHHPQGHAGRLGGWGGGEQVRFHLLEQELLGLRASQIQAVMVDELLLMLQPLTPAHGTDLFEGAEAKVVLEGPEGHLVAGLAATHAGYGCHASKIRRGGRPSYLRGAAP